MSLSIFPCSTRVLWQFCSWVWFLSFGCFCRSQTIVLSPGLGSLCYISMLKVLALFAQQLLEDRRDSILHVPSSLRILLTELDLGAAWNPCISFPDGFRKDAPFICLSASHAMPCHAISDFRHGEDHTAFFTVADTKVCSGSHWSVLKRCPAISELHKPLSSKTSCWSSHSSIRDLDSANLWLELPDIRFVTAPSPALSF